VMSAQAQESSNIFLSIFLLLVLLLALFKFHTVIVYFGFNVIFHCMLPLLLWFLTTAHNAGHGTQHHHHPRLDSPTLSSYILDFCVEIIFWRVLVCILLVNGLFICLLQTMVMVMWQPNST
jgi:hypothetical protein